MTFTVIALNFDTAFCIRWEMLIYGLFRYNLTSVISLHLFKELLGILRNANASIISTYQNYR